ncbi:MAG: lipocalin family protein [Prevotella sp.]|nr:lipocalin family protein [Prevotella sp.]
MIKTIRYFLIILLCCNIFMCCSDDDDNNNGTETSLSALVGKWRQSYYDGYIEMTFNKDGSGTEYEEGYAPGGYLTHFDWTYNERTRKLTIKYIDDDELDTEVYIVKSISQSRMILEDEDGDTQIWERYSYGDEDDDNNDGNKYSSGIVGTWRYSYESSHGAMEGYVFMTFNSNGTGVMREQDGSFSDELRFTYTYSKSTGSLILDYTDGEREKYTVLSITSNEMKVLDEYGDLTVLKRVRQ